MTADCMLLLSGGIDSTAVAYWKRPAHAVTVDYGQKAAGAEISAAAQITQNLGIRHHVIQAGLGALGSGNMADSVQLNIAPTPEWWPFRNQLLVTIAAALAVKNGCVTVMIGTVASDFQHSDGTPHFIQGMDRLLQMQEGGIRLEAPCASITQVELLGISATPLTILALCHSCHISDIPCGKCRGCLKSLEARKYVGLDTPT